MNAARDSAITLPTARECPFDPPAELQRLRSSGSLHRLSFPDGHLGWLVTGHSAARSVLADLRFSSRPELRHVPMRHAMADEPPAPAPPGWFLWMDPPEHSKYRRLLAGQFTVRRMNQLASRIEQLAEEHLDAMERRGAPADLVEHFAMPIPSLVICELLGVPNADRGEFLQTTSVAISLDATKEDISEAYLALLEFFEKLVAAKRVEPTDDLLGGLAATDALSDEELKNVGLLLLMAGQETTANMLALGTFALLRHPEQLAALREDAALLDGAVEELLRYLSILQFGAQRAAIADVEIDGQLIKAGETVVVSLPAVSRDPSMFADPNTLDIRRSTKGHLAFGYGVHQCLGHQLARLEMRIGYRALFSRFPELRLAVSPEEVPLRTDMAVYGVHRLPVAW